MEFQKPFHPLENPRVSFALPIFNEEETIPELLKRLNQVLDTIPGGPHEIVLVDDGSSDASLKLLQQAAAQDSRLVVVELSRNFGHQKAYTAALDHCSGDVIIPMDADLQDAPEAVHRFLDEYRKGYEVVYAVRVGRKESWLKKTCYSLFYRLVARLSETDLPRDSGDFGLLSNRVVRALKSCPERQRYIRGLRTWVGFKQTGIPVERDQRHAGETKYSFKKLLKLAFDAIFSFSVVPIRAVIVLGFTGMLFSLLYVIYAVLAKVLWHESPQGFTATVVMVSFMGGILLLCLGVIGEYVGRIYEEVKARPQYIVSSVVRKHP